MNAELWSLFAGSFLAATLLPGGSELLFVGLLARGETAPGLLFAAATLGNTLGGLSSWTLGAWLARFRPGKPPEGKALERVRRWGPASLLLSWVPLIGDPLCLAAGWLRLRLLPSLVCIALGKAARYGVILAGVA